MSLPDQFSPLEKFYMYFASAYILAVYQYCGAHIFPELGFFLMPLLTIEIPYLQLCYYDMIITISPPILLQLIYLLFCPCLGPKFSPILAYP